MAYSWTELGKKHKTGDTVWCFSAIKTLKGCHTVKPFKGVLVSSTDKTEPDSGVIYAIVPLSRSGTMMWSKVIPVYGKCFSESCEEAERCYKMKLSKIGVL